MSDKKRRKRLAYLLAAKASVDWRTAMKWILGETVSQLAAQALAAAASAESVEDEVERHRAAAAAA